MTLCRHIPGFGAADSSVSPVGTHWLISGDGAPNALGMLAAAVFAEGKGFPRHRLGVESAIVVLAGSGRWHDGGQTWSLGPGEGVFTPAGACRDWTATSDGTCLLMVYGGSVDPADAQPAPATARETGSLRGQRFAGVAEHGDGVLGEVGGFIDMGVHWLATVDTVGTRDLVVATSTFTQGGSHELHRHPHADEFFLVVDGAGQHLTANGEIRMNSGDLVFIPAGEWHGYRTDPNVITRAIYGYLGAGSLEQAGYELNGQEDAWADQQ